MAVYIPHHTHTYTHTRAHTHTHQLADVGCAVHLCSLLHCRYSEFSDLLLEQMQRLYSPPIRRDEDRSATVTKYRLGLRLLGEVCIAIFSVCVDYVRCAPLFRAVCTQWFILFLVYMWIMLSVLFLVQVYGNCKGCT